MDGFVDVYVINNRMESQLYDSVEFIYVQQRDLFIDLYLVVVIGLVRLEGRFIYYLIFLVVVELI